MVGINNLVKDYFLNHPTFGKQKFTEWPSV